LKEKGENTTPIVDGRARFIETEGAERDFSQGCDGQTLVIVMMRFASIFFPHYIDKIDEHFVIKDDLN